MALNNIEIEIQVNVENIQALESFLGEQAIFKYEARQVDKYFSPPHRDFLATRPTKEWLRLRQSGDACSWNYKNWYFNEAGESHYCDEYEVKIDDLDKAFKIMEALDFKVIATVDKRRRVFEYQDYEISLDSVKDLGEFVELEYIGKDDKVDPESVTKAMVNLLKEIGVGEIKRNHQGYPFLIMFPDEVKYEIL